MEKKLNRYIYKLMLIATVFLMPFPYFVQNTAYAEQPVAPSNELVLPEKPVAPNYDVQIASEEPVFASEESSQAPSSEQSGDSVVNSSESPSTSLEPENSVDDAANTDPDLKRAGNAENNNVSDGSTGFSGSATNPETGLSLPLNTPPPGQTTINNDNNATVDNGVSATLDTGSNESNYNTGDGSVSTGDANLVLSIVNMVNTFLMSASPDGIGLIFENIFGDLLGNYIFDPFTKESYTLTGSRVDLSNSNTGPESTNKAYLNSGQDVDVLNTQNALGNNQLDLNANTGNNSASYNTGSGDVTTGDANVSLNLFNLFNSSFYAANQGAIGVLNVFGDMLGNLVIPKNLLSLMTPANNQTSSTTIENNNTGPGSGNSVTADMGGDLSLNNSNNSNIQNLITTRAETGQNEAGYNTGNGNVATGDSNTDLNIENTANQNIVGDFVYYFLINVMGEWTGQNKLLSLLPANIISNSSGEGWSILIGNTNTGPDSVNDASLDSDTSIDLSNSNDSDIENNIIAIANTGGNSANYNTGSGSVKTGDANVLANVLNFANINVISKNFMFFVINIFGDWKGDIIDDAVVVDGGNNNGEPVIDNGNTGYGGGEIYGVSGTSASVKTIGGKPRALLASYSKVSNLGDSSDPVLVLGTSTDSPTGLYSIGNTDSNNDETLLQYMLNKFGIYFGFLAIGLAMIYILNHLRNRGRLSDFGNNLIERR